MDDIRWRQRFTHYLRALSLLLQAMETEDAQLNDLEREGLIQRFEYTFELAWKVIKDYLQYQGHVLVPPSPRASIKLAFATGVVVDGRGWLAMLDRRNDLAHRYDEATFLEATVAIRASFAGLFVALRERLQAEAQS